MVLKLQHAAESVGGLCQDRNCWTLSHRFWFMRSVKGLSAAMLKITVWEPFLEHCIRRLCHTLSQKFILPTPAKVSCSAAQPFMSPLLRDFGWLCVDYIVQFMSHQAMSLSFCAHLASASVPPTHLTCTVFHKCPLFHQQALLFLLLTISISSTKCCLLWTQLISSSTKDCILILPN